VPRDVSAVGSLLSGEVVKIYPEAELDRVVHEGQPLLQLDDREAKLKLEHAQIAVKLAQSDVTRAQESQHAAEVALDYERQLLKNIVGSKGKVEQAEAVVKAAEAAVNTAKVKVEEAEQAVRGAQFNLDLTVVRAPVTGRIIDKKVVNGQLIAPPATAQLFTICGELDRMQVVAQVAEADIGKIRAGQEATFTVYAYADDGTPFKGKIERVNPMPASVPGAMMQGAVFYNTVIDVVNRHDPKAADRNAWMLRPGMTATVDIRIRQHHNVWKVPTAAVSFQLEEAYYSDAAKRKLVAFPESRKDRDNWKPIWVMKDKKPWPIFVRVGGNNSAAETGIKDGQFYELLEWDPELQPNPADPKTYPEAIINAPPAHKPGLFDRPNLRIS
jgi:HlyD family secretion protein